MIANKYRNIKIFVLWKDTIKCHYTNKSFLYCVFVFSKNTDDIIALQCWLRWKVLTIDLENAGIRAEATHMCCYLLLVICAVKVRSQHNRKQVVISVKTLHLFSDEQNRLSSSRTFVIIIIFCENPSIMGHSFTLIWLEKKTWSNIWTGSDSVLRERESELSTRHTPAWAGWCQD